MGALSIRAFVAAFALVWALSAQAMDGRCERLLSAREYPASIDPAQNPDGHYMYGYEIEYAIGEMAPGVLLEYVPDETLISHDVWLKQMNHAQRVAWVRAHLQELFPQGFKVPGGLYLLTDRSGWPKQLILDETGNLEFIVRKPFDDYVSFERSLDEVTAKLGEGYVQASISIPSSLVYRDDVNADAYYGYRIFLGELDTITKLALGWKKHSETAQYIPAKSFTHPFLGPMNSFKANFFQRLLDENREGRYNDDVLDRVSTMNSSYKYTGQTVYRPDIIRSSVRFINEIRDCVKDPECLKERIQREKKFFARDITAFEIFKQVRIFDVIADYQILSDEAQRVMEQAFPRLMKDDDLKLESGSEILASEIYRNFAYPLQNWRSWFFAFELDPNGPEMKQVMDARAHYVLTLESLALLHKTSGASIEEIRSKMRVALSRFAAESGLEQVFRSWLARKFP
jgi:hypothetical protein